MKEIINTPEIKISPVKGDRGTLKAPGSEVLGRDHDGTGRVWEMFVLLEQYRGTLTTLLGYT